tara:strand:- start:842 stop:2065 length:1224 start_codon:yes stop_codon:yes gene_type:complete
MKLIDILKSDFNFSFSLILILSILSLDAFSHQRSESYSKWVLEEDGFSNFIKASFTIRLSNLDKLEGPLYGQWEKRVSENIISSFSVNENCLITDDPRLDISRAEDIFKVSWLLSCPNGLEEIKADIFFDKDPTHSHIARYTYSEDDSFEKLFTSQMRVWKIAESNQDKESSINSAFIDYIILGIKHISTGYDHLAFIFGLLLLNPKLKKLIIVITGFTLGHSLTLSLAVLDLVRPVSLFIEALIGFSIALLGIEFLVRQSKNKRNFVNNISLFLAFFFFAYIFIFEGKDILGFFGISLFTFCYLNLLTIKSVRSFSLFIACVFGLIHGFGFGGFLFEVGFSQEKLLKALIGFNLGVEVGQIVAVSIFFILLSWINKLKLNYQDLINPAFAISLVSLGLYWFVYRII